jgi:hypothetical protein
MPHVKGKTTMSHNAQLKTIHNNLVFKILIDRNRQAVADLAGIHINTVSRFLNKGNVGWGATLAIAKAVDTLTEDREP